MPKEEIVFRPPLNEDELADLQQEPWTETERNMLVRWIRVFHPHSKPSRSHGWEINGNVLPGTRWDAIVAQHNCPPPTKEEEEAWAQHQHYKDSTAYKFKMRMSKSKPEPEEYPIRKHNRCKEQIWEQLPQLYRVKKITCIDPDERRKLESRTKELFKRYTAMRAKTVSQQERRDKSLRNPSLVYGEVDVTEFGLLLQRCKQIYGHMMGIRGKFYDLGCGSGKPVYIAAAYHHFEACCGVETLTELVEMCEGLRGRFDAKVIKKFSLKEKEKRGTGTQIQFVETDLETTSVWQDGCVVFIHATAFDDAIMRKVADVSEDLVPGSLMITCTLPLPPTSSRWLHLFEETMRTAWGQVRVFVYEKLTSEIPARLRDQLSGGAGGGVGGSGGGGRRGSRRGAAAEDDSPNQGQNRTIQ